MPFFAFQYNRMQKLASFSLTGKFRAPPRRAAKMASFLLTDLSPSILRIGVAVNCKIGIAKMASFSQFSIPNFKEIENWELESKNCGRGERQIDLRPAAASGI